MLGKYEKNWVISENYNPLGGFLLQSSHFQLTLDQNSLQRALMKLMLIPEF